jgi:GNAT superfamily N-acetyltransferase
MAEDKAQVIIDAGPVFVTTYEDKTLVGVTWASGDGRQWLVGGNYVLPKYRRQGIATGLRSVLVNACREKTMGRGTIYGIHMGQEAHKFYESLGWKLTHQQTTAYSKFLGKL